MNNSKQPMIAGGSIIFLSESQPYSSTNAAAYQFSRGYYRVKSSRCSDLSKDTKYHSMVYDMDRVSRDNKVMVSKSDPGRRCSYVDALYEQGKIIIISLPTT